MRTIQLSPDARGVAPIAVPAAPPCAAATRSTITAGIDWVERRALFVAAMAVGAALMLNKVPAHMLQDTWLALVDGRFVAQHGIPHHDTMAVLTHGARWIDQQWLSQLALYGLHQLGGMALVGGAYVILSIGAASMAIAAARRLGAIDTHVAWVLPVAAFLYLAAAFQVRTQGFAYPLFVAVLWLLANEVRTPTRRRGYLALPILVLWGNLHGSVVIGAAITGLYGITLLIGDVRDRRRLHARTAVFIVGPLLCLLATPYGISGLSYYHETLMNPVFKTLVTEWRPVTSVSALAVPFFALAFAIVWVFGKLGSRLRLFDALVLLMLTAASISAVRNVAWFGLAAIVLVPSMLTTLMPERHPAPRRPRVNLALVAIAVIFLLGSLVNVATRRAAWFESSYDARALRTVSTFVAAHPTVRVYADGHFADWLLWHDRALMGRINYDSRIELMSQKQLSAVSGLAAIRPHGTPDLLGDYGLLVFDSTNATTRLLLSRLGVHVLMRGRGVIVAQQTGARGGA